MGKGGTKKQRARQYILPSLIVLPQVSAKTWERKLTVFYFDFFRLRRRSLSPSFSTSRSTDVKENAAQTIKL